MKAMLLAAGFGKRLRPLTERMPKSLVPVVNRPAISRNIDYLKSYGVKNIIVNACAHFHQLLEYLERGSSWGVNIDVRVEPEILGTGGGIRNCADFFDNDTFMVINSDILTDIDLGAVWAFHKSSGEIATLVLHNYPSFNQIKIDNRSQILDIGFTNKEGRLSFACIHILEPTIFSFIPGSGYSDIVDCYRKIIASKIPINAYVSRGHYWHDIGKPDSYIHANLDMLKRENGPFFIGPGSAIAPSVRFEDWAIIGENACVENDVVIKRSILWDHVNVKSGVQIVDSILTSYREVERDVREKII